MSERVYPLPRTENDPRFIVGLAIDVSSVLVKHGYYRVRSDGDLAALQQALFGFLYGTGKEAGR